MKKYKTPMFKPHELRVGRIMEGSKPDPKATSTDQMTVKTINDGWEDE